MVAYIPPSLSASVGFTLRLINHSEFWDWCREKVEEGHIVFVSEYNAPDDFECIWSKEVTVSGNNIHKEKLTNTEKLFVLKSEGRKK